MEQCWALHRWQVPFVSLLILGTTLRVGTLNHCFMANHDVFLKVPQVSSGTWGSDDADPFLPVGLSSSSLPITRSEVAGVQTWFLCLFNLSLICCKIHSDKCTTVAGYKHTSKFPLGCFIVSSCYTHGFLKQAPQAVLFTARDKSHHFRALFRAAIESCVLLESLSG